MNEGRKSDILFGKERKKERKKERNKERKKERKIVNK